MPETAPTPRSITREKRVTPISHTRAMEAATRLINSHFQQQEPRARISIPVSMDDDDVVILDYIAEQIEKEFVCKSANSTS